MTNREILEKLVSRRNQDYQSLSYISDVLLSEKDEDEPDVGLILQYGKYLKGVSAQKAREDSRNLDVYYRALFALAKYDFDSYLIYMEKDREPKERFYLPRREKLIKIGAIQLLQDLEDDKLDVGGLSIPPGCGKAQPLYSKVLTPDGFKPMGDIHVGDNVIAGNGKTAKVLGVYPQGVKSIYEITLDDGSTCRCSEDHLWSVKTRDDRTRHKPDRVIPLSQMLKNVKVEGDKRCNYSIAYVNPIEFPEKELPLHPYVVGALIGNGNLMNNTPIFSTADSETLGLFMSFLPDRLTAKNIFGVNYRIVEFQNGYGRKKWQRSYLKNALMSIGLLGKKSNEKHIPELYKYASKKQRIWLLKGLLDTDGTCNKSECT